MIFRGACDDIDGVRSSYITILVRSHVGVWLPLPFLSDLGTGATFLDASCLQQVGAALGAGVAADEHGLPSRERVLP
jgi:hypothetical protein